jgi:exonuclease III
MLKFASWNVRGLEMPNGKYVVIYWRKKLQHTYFVLLQEIKVIGYYSFIVIKFIWKEAKHFSSSHEKAKGVLPFCFTPNRKNLSGIVEPPLVIKYFG